jgi:hypothetical protein
MPLFMDVHNIEGGVPAADVAGAHDADLTSITWFTSLDAVRGLAGDDYEPAVVEETAREALSRWDERVCHHEVAVDLDHCR